MKPLAIDLFCGLGGWTEGLLAEGYDVVGFDNHAHVYGEHRYPAQLVIQDVLTLHGSQFRHASLIVASPPCQAYSYRAMPWKRAKALPPPDNSLFEACFRLQREAIAAAGRFIPLVVENVRGAQPWVGRSRWNYGSFHLWGDVPALMPMTMKRGQKVAGFRFDGSGKSFQSAAVAGTKVPGLNWSGSDKPGYKAQAFNSTAERRAIDSIKNTGGSWFAVAHNTASGKGRNPDGRNNPRDSFAVAAGRDDVKCGGDWFDASEDSQMRRHGLNSVKRRYASAVIAKIPEVLARHIGRAWYPVEEPQCLTK